MYCPNCGTEIKPTVKFCPSCGKPVVKEETATKEPPSEKAIPKTTKTGTTKKILIGVLLAIVLLIAGNFLFRTLKRGKISIKRQLLATYDQYPIWLLRDGKVAVLREMKVYTNTVEKQIIVKNLSDNKEENVKITEVIPKKIVRQASHVTFSPQPKIVEEDPEVEWEVDVPAKKQVNLSWKTKNLKYALPKKVLGVQANEPMFLKNFKERWPTLNLKKPVETWHEIHEFSQKAMQESAQQATTGKVITISKDATDIMATMVTGTGILDTLTVLSELHSIGTTLYGEETPEAIENANWWLTAGSLVKAGYDNKDLLKTTMQTGIEVIKNRQGIKAAATANKLMEAANTVDPETGVTAAEGVGLNIAGMIVDYAIINDVAQSSKYFLFEANEQAKMEYASRYLVEWWQKYESGDFTESDAKKIMEMEILFFTAQQKELGVRKAYFQSQQGILDSVQYWLPFVGWYSARSGAQEAEDNLKTGENQLRLRYTAREEIYQLSQGKEVGLQSLEEAEKEALEKAKAAQAIRELIKEVVEYGSQAYETIRKSITNISRETTKLTPPATPSPTSVSTPNVSKTLNFSLNNFPSTLLGLPQIKTNTTLDPDDQCNSKISPSGFIEVLYGNNEKIIDTRVVKLESESQAKAAPKTMADCMGSVFGLSTAVEEKESVLNYPLSLITADTQIGRITDSSFVVIDKYMIGVSILTPEKTGGSESEHREIMKILVPAFLTGE